MPPEDLQKLKRAIAGLLYPSESDEPFDIFTWEAAKAPGCTVLMSHVAPSRKVVELSLDQFISQLDDSDDAARYHELKDVLESILSRPAVFRVGDGEVRVDIYIIGEGQDGKWAGLHTLSVET